MEEGASPPRLALDKKLGKMLQWRKKQKEKKYTLCDLLSSQGELIRSREGIIVHKRGKRTMH